MYLHVKNMHISELELFIKLILTINAYNGTITVVLRLVTEEEHVELSAYQKSNKL